MEDNVTDVIWDGQVVGLFGEARPSISPPYWTKIRSVVGTGVIDNEASAERHAGCCLL